MWLLDILKELLDFILHPIRVDEQHSMHDPLPAPVTKLIPEVVEVPKYLWDTPENARHSVRLICDEEGLTWQQKEDMSSTVHCESGYLTGIIHPNLDKNGKLSTTDYGICQWNDWWHWIKNNIHEISPDEALHNPEKAVRLMCQYVKWGLLTQWVCFESGMYKHYPA